MKKLIKPGEMITTTTVRIEAGIGNDNISQTGTGFFYSIDNGGDYVPMIITNKHVVEGMKQIFVVFTMADEYGNKIDKYTRYNIKDVAPFIVMHPNVDIDLCAISLFPIINEFKSRGEHIYTYYVSKAIIPDAAKLNELDAIEEIIMVGYPNGIWDARNNLPLVRKGITATHPGISYNGESIFLIDAASFPGSSGSPVYYQFKQYKQDVGADRPGYEVSLLGVMFAGPQTTLQVYQRTEAERVIIENYIENYVDMPIGLGHVISSSELLVLEDEVKKQLPNKEQNEI